MADGELEDRLYQAFVRGYHEFAADDVRLGSAVAAFPYMSVINAASLESKELRRSIDACHGALAQLASLPPAEQDQLKTETRASLEALESTGDRLLARLRSLRPSSKSLGTSTDIAAPATKRATSARPKKTRSRR
jgi:hypothetical protein